MRKASPRWRARFAAGAVVLPLLLLAAAAPGEEITVGTQKTVGAGALYIPQEKGYFAAEGLTVKLVFFPASEAVPVAVVSGDLDFGAGGMSAGFYNLAGQGALKLIGGYLREAPEFQAEVVVASKKSAAAGLVGWSDLPDHSAAVAEIGGPAHYALGLVAAKFGFDIRRVRLVPLQSNPNVASAVVGGQVDAGMLASSFVKPAIQQGDVRVIGWIGEVAPWQLGGVYTGTRTADQRRDTVERFLRAYRRGVHEFYDAFTTEDGHRRDGPTAPEVIAIIGKYTGQTEAQVRLSIVYFDPKARLDVGDILRQIDWYKGQGLVKGAPDGRAMIDGRYVVPRPTS